MIKIPEVILTKNDTHPYDYKKMSFGDYIKIHNLAQEVADNIGYPIYLVGSAQFKHEPRDVDLAIIIPHDLYAEKYIKHNEHEWDTTNPETSASAYMTNAWYAEFESIKSLESLNFDGYKIDLKLCPDNWFIEKPKLLLATPNKKEV